jgi:hypothetical protein
MNRFELSLVSVALAFVSAGQTYAQGRTKGGYLTFIEWSAAPGHITQVASSNNGGVAPSQLSMTSYANSSTGYFTMPFDVPGDCIELGGGEFLASGKNANNSNGYLVRFHLIPGSPMAAVIDETVVRPGMDPDDLAWDSGSLRLTFLDSHAQTVHSATWSGALPASFATIWSFTSPLDPVMQVRGPEAQENPGVYCLLLDQDTGPTYSGSRAVRLYEISPGVWGTMDVSNPQPTNFVPGGWSIREALAVPEQGTVELRNEVTTDFLIFDEIAQSAVFFGQLQSVGQWESVTFPILAVGGRYSIMELGGIKSRVFSPSFRLGAPSNSGNYAMRKGRINPLNLVVGNDNFAVGGGVFWESLNIAAPNDVAAMWVWAAVEEPGPQAVVTVPTGEVILANPLVAIPYEIALAPDAVFGLQPVVGFPMSNDPGIATSPILFQWICFLGDGSIVVSDVFGSRVLPAPGGGGASAMIASGAGASSNTNWINTNVAARAKARQWLHSLPCSACPSGTRGQAMQRFASMNH